MADSVPATISRMNEGMTTSTTDPVDLTIPARDGCGLSASIFGGAGPSSRVVIINNATAVPQRFYRHFAAELAGADYTALTYDYRGWGSSSPNRGFSGTTPSIGSTSDDSSTKKMSVHTIEALAIFGI